MRFLTMSPARKTIPTSSRRLLAGGSLFLFTLSPLPAAHAAQPASTPAPGSAAPHAHASAAHRRAAARPAARRAAPAATRAARNEDVSIVATRGVSHDTEQVVTRAAIERMVGGTNPLKSLAQLPGVSFSSSDALGLDTWGASIYLRGYFMDQLGVTLDGVPLNDQSYGSVNGLNILTAVIPDDLGRESVSQGAGAVNLPSNSNLGGTMQFFTDDPADHIGGKVSQGFGSYAMYRTYARFDSGRLNASGTKFFASYARDYEGKYQGGGSDFMQQADGKLVQPIGHDSSISAFFNWSDSAVWGYSDKSLEILNKLGWRVESFYPNYAAAYATAAGTYLPPGWDQITGQDPKTVAFYDAGQHTVDYLGGLNLDFALTDRLRWRTTFYGHSDTSYLTYGDPNTPSATGAPLSEEVWQPRQQRMGFDTALQYRLGNHTIETGVWYENNIQTSGQYWYNEPLLGQGAPVETVGPYDVYGPAFQQSYNFAWTTNTVQYHLMDTWRPLHNLTVHAGFKTLAVTTSGGSDYNNPDVTGVDSLPNGSLSTVGAFLPHVSANWRFLPGHELYFDLAENMRSYVVGASGAGGYSASPWSVQDQPTFKQLQHTLRPERDWVYLVGYRYTSKRIIASLDGYHSDISHKLISASVGTLNNPVASVIDTHSATMNGVDAGLTLVPVRGLSIFNTVSYNHATYGQNVLAGQQYYPLAGKKMVGYPEFMYKTSAIYTYGPAQVHFDANYYSKREFSYLNDTHIPGYWLANAGARYRFGSYGAMKNITVDFNVYNLFNAKYIAMMGENGFPMSGDYQSLERGAVREYFGTVTAQF